jgi:ribosomal protein L11
LHAPELITDQQLIINQVIEIAKEHALSFEIKLSKVQELINQAIKVEEGSSKVTTRKAVHFNEDEEDKESDEEDEEDGQIEDFEYQMLQEIAETLLAMTNLVRPSINENDLYILVSSGVESL